MCVALKKSKSFSIKSNDETMMKKQHGCLMKEVSTLGFEKNVLLKRIKAAIKRCSLKEVFWKFKQVLTDCIKLNKIHSNCQLEAFNFIKTNFFETIFLNFTKIFNGCFQTRSIFKTSSLYARARKQSFKI